MSATRYKKTLRERIREVDPQATDQTVREVRVMVIEGNKQIPTVLRKCMKIQKDAHGVPNSLESAQAIANVLFPFNQEAELRSYVLLCKEAYI